MGIQFITPETVTLHLADVQRRAHADLVAAAAKDKAKKVGLAESQARLDDAIADGSFVVIKKRLSHGEREAMFKLARETGNLKTAEVVAYLVRWSSPTPYALGMTEQERIDIINGLDAESFDEIQNALIAHVAAQAEEKKLRAGANGSSPISLSAAPITGPMTTSEHSPQMSTMSSVTS